MQSILLLVPFLYLCAIAFPLAIVDLREHRLPNKWTLSAALITISCLAGTSALSGDWLAYLQSLGAAAITFLIGWFLAAKEAIGMGDVKLLVSLNAFAGYLSPLLPLVAFAAAMVAASMVGAISLLRRRVTRESSIALGPYLLGGFFLTVAPSALSATAGVWS
jgi:leader peptidase (prepilin peptidase)/N-methyltransferase